MSFMLFEGCVSRVSFLGDALVKNIEEAEDMLMKVRAAGR